MYVHLSPYVNLNQEKTLLLDIPGPDHVVKAGPGKAKTNTFGFMDLE